MITWMLDYFSWFVFWSQPRRRWVVKLTVWRRCPRRLNRWLLDQLYPAQAGVSFGSPSRESDS